MIWNIKSVCYHIWSRVDSSPPSAIYMRQWTGQALVHVMACRLFGTKPLPEAMRVYMSIGPLGTNFRVIWIKIQKVLFIKNAFESVIREMAAILSRGGGGGGGETTVTS